MQQFWTPDDLAEHWTLTGDELRLLDPKTDHNRLGFALLLKFFLLEGRFPRSQAELPEAAVAHVARQVGVASGQLQDYKWGGRAIKDHRAQIRETLGFRSARVEDAEALTAWLSHREEAPTASSEHLHALVYQRCRELRIEPPAPSRLERVARAAVRLAHERFCEAVFRQLSPATIAAFDALLEPTSEGLELTLAELKADPGRATLDSVLTEIAKLQALRGIGLPEDLFRARSPKLIGRFRQRAAAEPPRELRAHAAPLRYTLLAALCFLRIQETTDNLIDLLIAVIHRIGTRAEERVEEELLTDLRRVRGKTNLLFEVAEAALADPDGRVRDVVYPVVGEQTLRELVREHRASGPIFRKRVHTVMRASYQWHYRRMVPQVLTALEFRSNNARHRPVVEALELLRQRATSGKRYYVADLEAPIEGVVRPLWRELLLEPDPDGGERVNRINYEICVLETLREKLRCKEIWG